MNDVHFHSQVYFILKCTKLISRTRLSIYFLYSTVCRCFERETNSRFNTTIFYIYFRDSCIIRNIDCGASINLNFYNFYFKRNLWNSLYLALVLNHIVIVWSLFRLYFQEGFSISEISCSGGREALQVSGGLDYRHYLTGVRFMSGIWFTRLGHTIGRNIWCCGIRVHASTSSWIFISSQTPKSPITSLLCSIVESISGLSSKTEDCEKVTQQLDSRVKIAQVIIEKRNKFQVT